MVAPTLRLAASSLVRQRMPVMAATAAPRLAAPSMLRTAAPRAVAPTSFAVARRGYASSSGLSQQEIQNRIVEILKSFEKVDPAKVNAEASFTSTLGLDSLDAVEVVMAIEEEFNIEIPDADADAITTVGQAIEYISKTPEAQ
ncbi:acyl carrier protein [Jaminaea rosea]|uniref:Acyl carrier protein n=1 Tax=Jaminaea rosea TaxID=1569628 RepID=A0A316UPY6_9BASI|nr:acyl carrier protein [Jaminaea rosea]PWN27034.1 acyl carrier protein [Jaminaea rosea]